MSQLILIAQRLISLADIGIQFASNDYERDRSHQIRALALDILSITSDHPIETLKAALPITTSYPTPKVDVRTVVFDDLGRLLLVQEKMDNRWALPGGWAEVGLTPRESAEKECREEAGVEVEVDALWAVIDKKGWGHPNPLYSTYKLFFHGRPQTSDAPTPGYEVHDARFFGSEEIPPLSIERTTPAQVAWIFERKNAPNAPTLFN